MIYVFAKHNGNSISNSPVMVGSCTGYYPYGPLYNLATNTYDLKYRCLNNSAKLVNGAINYAGEDITAFDPRNAKIAWRELEETGIETSESILELYITNQVKINPSGDGSVTVATGSNKALRDARLTLYSYDVYDADKYSEYIKPTLDNDNIITPPYTSIYTEIWNHLGDHLVTNGWCKASLNRGVRVGRGKKNEEGTFVTEAEGDVFVYNKQDITASQNETSEKWIRIGGWNYAIDLRPTAYYGVTDDETGEEITDFTKDNKYRTLKPCQSSHSIYNSESVANVCLVMDPPEGATPGYYWFVVTVLGWYT